MARYTIKSPVVTGVVLVAGGAFCILFPRSRAPRFDQVLGWVLIVLGVVSLIFRGRAFIFRK